ncbi:hypothetical protein CFAM422_011154 [Trichoderma lentiforme]|uniref:Uncharacterized protein n=1 Tax=Trichoderma lentiforme TaxID=1567552 RepID=A0A9P4X686_9HYPO|nr:hypothetical protein CFAM422_011154 [Trichoderma lentiforme]
MFFKNILYIAIGAAALVAGAPTASERDTSGEADIYSPPVEEFCLPCGFVGCPAPLVCRSGCCVA